MKVQTKKKKIERIYDYEDDLLLIESKTGEKSVCLPIIIMSLKLHKNYYYKLIGTSKYSE